MDLHVHVALIDSPEIIVQFACSGKLGIAAILSAPAVAMPTLSAAEK